MPSNDKYLKLLGRALLGLGVLHFLAIAGCLFWFFLVGGAAPDGLRVVMGYVAGMILSLVAVLIFMKP